MTRRISLGARIGGWFLRQVPTRERVAASRWIAPLAHRAELWRFTRRTVPRGVAVGVFVGILVMIPGAQVVTAALLCVPLRANVPLAAASTFVSIPPTVLFVFLPAAAAIGNRFGYHADLAMITAMLEHGASGAQWLAWLGSDAAPSLALGLIVLASLGAVGGYALAAGVWRARVAARWRARAAKATLGGDRAWTP